jgi:hypothetical protein
MIDAVREDAGRQLVRRGLVGLLGAQLVARADERHRPEHLLAHGLQPSLAFSDHRRLDNRAIALRSGEDRGTTGACSVVVAGLRSTAFPEARAGAIFAAPC